MFDYELVVDENFSRGDSCRNIIVSMERRSTETGCLKIFHNESSDSDNDVLTNTR